MIRHLNSSEGQYAAVILVMVAAAGVAMAAVGRSDPLGVHGVLVVLFAGALLYPASRSSEFVLRQTSIGSGLLAAPGSVTVLQTIIVDPDPAISRQVRIKG